MRLAEVKLYFILFFCLSTVLFFEPVFIPNSLPFYSYVFCFVLSLFIIITSSKKLNFNSFAFPVFLMLFAQVFATLNTTISWTQELSESIRAVLPQMSYLLFFLLVALSLNLKQIEKLILILGITYIVVFLFSYIKYPATYFGDIAVEDETRGFQRIRSSGVGFLYLLSFFSLSEYVLKRKYFWLMIYLITMICIVMTLSRISIFCSILLSAFFYFKNINKTGKYLFPIVLFIFVFVFTQTKTYELFVEETNSQKSYANDDIRVQAIKFYLKDFSPNTVSIFLGNGVPGNPTRITNKNTEYAKYVSSLENIYHLYISDIGYFGLFVKFGLLSIMSFLFFIYKILSVHLSIEYLYSKYFLIFIFLISFIVDAPFNTSFIPAIILAYYIVSLQSVINKTV